MAAGPRRLDMAARVRPAECKQGLMVDQLTFRATIARAG